ncbi:unnamed protein product, partial [Didymodactylos carnosus]
KSVIYTLNFASLSMTKETSSPIHHLAVYGTLRDDDNSGAAWTEAFVKDIKSAITGKVRGAKMYWNTDLKYPFVTLTGIHTDSITVRVLEWFSDEQFQNKIIEADRIEGYFPDQPDFDSEYVRK